MKTKNLSTFKIHKLTKAQYDREVQAGTIDQDALYLTPKADAEHGHAISEVADLQSNLDQRVPLTRKINGKELSVDLSLIPSDIGAMTDVEVTSADNGKFMRVVDGSWAAVSVPSAEEATF